MSSIYMDSFEQYGTGTTGNSNLLLGPWVNIQSNGSLGVLQTPIWGARTGNVAMTCIQTSGGTNTYELPSTKTEIFMSLGFSVGSLPSTNFQSQICSFQNSSQVDIVRLWCQSNGYIVLTDNNNNILASTTNPVITTNSVFYFLEMDFNPSSGIFTLRVNDNLANKTPVIQVTGLSLGSNPINYITFVTCSRLELDWIDDIYIRDTLGTINNSWLGNRYIATIFPSGNSPYSIQPPENSTFISAIQLSLLTSTPPYFIITPSQLFINTPSGLNLDIPVTTNSVLVGEFDGSNIAVPEQLVFTSMYYNSIYETDPDTGNLLTPLSVANSSLEVNNLLVNTLQSAILIAYGTGISSTNTLPAWTFVLDGHRFYVISLGPEGDWAYDFTTQEWCQLQTQGFPGLNLTHGTMWGLRIIGSDALYNYLYELDPTQPLDEQWREVQHMVTGGVATRTRSVIGVANFTVTASVGLDSEIDQAISLAFSDDNGVTWSQEFDEPLTNMSSQMLIWNALGSFAAPGRVFRITDYSGPIRLDGADVVLTIGSGADSGQETDGQPAR